MFSSDRLFGFVTWNYPFRSSVNLSHSSCTYDNKDATSAEGKLTAQPLEKGAIEISKSLWSIYTDVTGNKESVGGYMTKVCYVHGLSLAEQIVLNNISYTTRRIPGTQETRIMMIFATQAYRIRDGTPIFITCSPDEGHNLLMIR